MLNAAVAVVHNAPISLAGIRTADMFCQWCVVQPIESFKKLSVTMSWSTANRDIRTQDPVSRKLRK